MQRNIATPSARLNFVICHSSSVSVAERETSTMSRSNVVSYDKKATLKRSDVIAINTKLEAKAKALITLEERQIALRPKAHFSLRSRVGMGDYWKIVGSCPELGRGSNEVAPKMRWTEGDVWVLDVPIREGNHTFKAVLRRADGAYIGEKGDKPRVLEVKPGMSKDSTINVELDAQLPW